MAMATPTNICADLCTQTSLQPEIQHMVSGSSVQGLEFDSRKKAIIQMAAEAFNSGFSDSDDDASEITHRSSGGSDDPWDELEISAVS